MTNTSQNPITVDGVRLDTLAHNISAKVGRDIMPSVAGSNIDTGLRHGQLWVPHKKFGPGQLVLKMWVSGCDEDGVVPVDGDDYWQYMQNLDNLKRMFAVHNRLLDVRHTIKRDGSVVRQALAEVTIAIPPDKLAAYPYTSEFTVEMTMPGSFWQNVADTTFDTNAGVLANSDHTLPAPWPAATAPMTDLYVVVDGPATNPKVIDNRSGHYVQLNSAIGPGIQWVVNTATWSSKTGVGIEFTDGGTDRYGETVFAGAHAPTMFGLVADPAGPQVRIEGTGFGAGTRLRIRGKLKYL
jgi:hypothetical protein